MIPPAGLEPGQIVPPPSSGVGLGSPLESCSVYGDLTRSVHTVNNLCMFNCQ